MIRGSEVDDLLSAVVADEVGGDHGFVDGGGGQRARRDAQRAVRVHIHQVPFTHTLDLDNRELCVVKQVLVLF